MRFLPLAFIGLVLSFTFCGLAAAQQGHLVLLTVSESGDDLPFAPQTGGTADLFLEVRPGNGQIFLDTFPLSRLDTQSSTRFANQVACNYLDIDCSRYDFFYTIRADTAIVGGPSAGAATAVLTAAVLQGEPLDESIAMTGTINSGGVIGPVAGLVAKVTAAKERGIRKVLISSFAYPTDINETYLASLNLSRETTVDEIRNASINLTLLYRPVNLTEIGIPVVDVASIGQALDEFRGEQRAEDTREIGVPSDYTRIMRAVSDQLCERREELAAALPPPSPSTPAAQPGEQHIPINGSNETREPTTANEMNATKRLDAARTAKAYYSLASYCFSDAVRFRTAVLEQTSLPERRARAASLTYELANFERNLARRNLTTLAELETSMIVQERVSEAAESLRTENRTNMTADALGYAVERTYSANAWSNFFPMESPQINLDATHLRQACSERLFQADERLRYVELYVPNGALEQMREEIARARGNMEEERYPLCLFYAGKAQALGNLYAGSLSIPQEKIGPLVEEKLAAAREVILRQEEKGYFPILGYSYYQYAQSLRESDPILALTFSEYSLEFSNLDLYFPREKRRYLPEPVASMLLFFICVLVAGILLGTFLGLFIGQRRMARAIGAARRVGRKTQESPPRKAKGFPGKKR